MVRFRSGESLGMLGIGLGMALSTACSGFVTPNDGGSGGVPGPAGGSMSSGGALASGGSTGSGGHVGVGGASGGAGGTNPGGGTTSAGGAGQSGGSAGDGGGSSGGSANTCPVETPLTGGQEYCSNSKAGAGSGYGYELWFEGPGTGCMTVHGVEAAFSAEWSGGDEFDFLARVGLDYGQNQTHQEIGRITAEFAETKTEEGGGLTYIGIYGWTVSPLTEFYILDDWGSVKPGGFSSDGTPRDEVGTLVADGETYDVWKKTRVDKPAITGPSETFDQYFSIRRTARQCGTISVSEHFEQWEELGLELGNFHEVKLLAEAQFNSGTITFTTARFVVE